MLVADDLGASIFFYFTNSLLAVLNDFLFNKSRFFALKSACLCVPEKFTNFLS